MTAILCFQLALFCIFSPTIAREKRILLSDPAFVAQEVTRLQSELLKLQVQIQQQAVGFAGGSLYTSPGGAANAVCMPDNPTWGSDGNIKPHYPAFLYGAEYKDTEIFGMANLKEDVPCTVCRNSAHSTVTMLPGRTDCYPGWSEAYNGLLTAGYPSNTAPSEYVCMDGHPEAMMGGGRLDDYGYLFYSVLAKCGSLPCPPYENNKVLSCVVCMM